MCKHTQMCGDAQEETTFAELLWLPAPGSAPCHQPFISVNAPSPSSGSQEDWDLNITKIPAAVCAGFLCESHQLWSTSKKDSSAMGGTGHLPAGFAWHRWRMLQQFLESGLGLPRAISGLEGCLSCLDLHDKALQAELV